MEFPIVSLRVAAATLLVCAGGYTLAVLGVGRLMPESAAGSLVTRPDKTVVGSRLIAQKFAQPGYFWPRPSAPDYDAARAGGSNESPTSPDLTARAEKTVGRFGATPERPLPAELAAASGSGLDPHLTLPAALYQAERVAGARGVAPDRIAELVAQRAFSPGGPLTPDRLVNVLELNLALDRELAPPPGGALTTTAVTP